MKCGVPEWYSHWHMHAIALGMEVVCYIFDLVYLAFSSQYNGLTCGLIDQHLLTVSISGATDKIIYWNITN